MFHSPSSGYAIRINTPHTTKQALRITSLSSRKQFLITLTTRLLLTATFVSFLAAGFAATAITSQQAHANVISDLVCVSVSDGSDAGSFFKSEQFKSLGGSTASMREVLPGTKKHPTNLNALLIPNSAGAVTGLPKKYTVTALERYGAANPQFSSWTPGFKDSGSFTFHGVAAKDAGVAQDGSGQVSLASAAGSEELQAGSSKLFTSNPVACTNLSGEITTLAANTLSVPARLMVTATAQVFTFTVGQGITDDSSVLHPLVAVVDTLITGKGGLRDTLFVPFLTPLILIGAVWVGYMGIVKRAAVVALQGTGWMIAAVAMGTVFLAQPSLVPGYVDGFVQKAKVIFNDGINVSQPSDALCKASGKNVTSRQSACLLWEAAIYQPWVSGQFGTTRTTTGSVLTNDPRHILKNSSYTAARGKENIKFNDWAEFQLDRSSTNRALQISEVAYAQLGTGTNGLWAGDSQGQITQAVMMNITALAVCSFPLLLSLTSLMLQILTLLAITVSPFFFLLGVVPSWGTRVVFRWFELLANIGIRSIVNIAVFAVYMLVFGLMMAASVPTVLVVVLTLALGLAAFKMRGFLNSASTARFGGDARWGLPGASKLTAALSGGAATIVSGNLFTGMNAAKRGNDDAQAFAPQGGKGGKLSGSGSPTSEMKPLFDAGRQVNKAVASSPTPAAAPARTVEVVQQVAPPAQPAPTPKPASAPAPAPRQPAPSAQPQQHVFSQQGQQSGSSQPPAPAAKPPAPKPARAEGTPPFNPNSGSSPAPPSSSRPKANSKPSSSAPFPR